MNERLIDSHPLPLLDEALDHSLFLGSWRKTSHASLSLSAHVALHHNVLKTPSILLGNHPKKRTESKTEGSDAIGRTYPRSSYWPIKEVVRVGVATEKSVIKNELMSNPRVKARLLTGSICWTISISGEIRDQKTAAEEGARGEAKEPCTLLRSESRISSDHLSRLSSSGSSPLIIISMPTGRSGEDVGVVGMTWNGAGESTFIQSLLSELPN